jgi:tungstate transport system ATP-binding protein
VTDSPILAARDVKVVKDKRTILSVPSIEVRDGEVLAVIGPNGAGKTTLLSVLACLERPSTGEVLYRGQPVTKRGVLSVRRRMAVVFQEALLLDGSVLENVMLGLQLRGKKEGAEAEAAKWLERFGIQGVSGQSRHTLSGGEAQRASLARAFALSPEILFMDEPFAAVDVISRQSLINQFREAQQTAKTATVLVTHDFDEVSMLASRVLVLHQGIIQAEGTPDEIAAHDKWGVLARGGRYLGNNPR